jgi:hypothetical protein
MMAADSTRRISSRNVSLAWKQGMIVVYPIVGRSVFGWDGLGLSVMARLHFLA